MARSRRVTVIDLAGPVEDTRPVGSLLRADPSGAVFAQRFNTFDEPMRTEHDRVPAVRGINTVNPRYLPFDNPQYHKRHAEDED